MCDISLEPATAWSETDRTARKALKCSSCGGTIAPGAVYTRHFSVCDGSLSNQKICGPCKEARADFADAHDGMLPLPDYFPELLNECIADGDEESEKMWKPMLAALQQRAASASEPAEGSP